MVAFFAFGTFLAGFGLAMMVLWTTVVPVLPRIAEALRGNRASTGIVPVRIVERHPAFRIQASALQQRPSWREAA